jgi:hypothetical protein
MYLKLNQTPESTGRNWKMFSNKDYANRLISELLQNDEPCMIARFGSTEMLCLVNFLGVKQNSSKWSEYIKGKTPAWWWEPNIIDQLQKWSGFFPGRIEKVEQFCELMIKDIPEVDLLGSWLLDEKYFKKELTGCKKVVLEDLEPFFTNNPWTRALSGKKVLVVHPFAETIEAQYRKRKLLFDNDLLPAFDLKIIKAVQSIAGEKTAHADWFAALKWMEEEIDKVDYDIAIVGCGAYGFPLAAHIKRSGKKAIHLAGVTQLLFGIKGKRWEEFIVWPYTNLFNEHWVYPGEKEKPKNATVVEGACYW